jgi:hypothetical protein
VTHDVSHQVKLSDPHAQQLAGALHGNLSLRELVLGGSWNQHGDSAVRMDTAMTSADYSDKVLGLAEAKVLAAFLPKCPGLSALDISGNMLEKNGALALSKFIRTHQSLTALTFSGSLASSTPVSLTSGTTSARFRGANLELSGTILMCAFLRKCPRLVALDISSCRLRDTGLMWLAREFRSLVAEPPEEAPCVASLKVLNVSDNEVSPAALGSGFGLQEICSTAGITLHSFLYNPDD